LLEIALADKIFSADVHYDLAFWYDSSVLVIYPEFSKLPDKISEFSTKSPILITPVNGGITHFGSSLISAIFF
jgi:hypothetical protein